MSTYGAAALALAMRRLKPYTDSIPSGDLEAELTLSSMLIRAQYPCIGSYDNLTGDDVSWFDIATGALASMSILASAIQEDNDGLSKIKTPNYEYTFVQPDATQKEQWQKDFTQAVNFITCIRRAKQSIAATTDIMSVSGRTRYRESTGRYTLPRQIAFLLPVGYGGDRISTFGSAVTSVYT